MDDVLKQILSELKDLKTGQTAMQGDIRILKADLIPESSYATTYSEKL